MNSLEVRVVVRDASGRSGELTMAIIVTGAGGFIGRHVVRALLHSGRHVIATDRETGGIEPHDRLRVVTGNLGDATVQRDLFANGASALVHLAALPGGAAERDHEASFRVNVATTSDLLNLAARNMARPRVVFASTIAVFGDPLPPDGVNDETTLAPRLIYGAHKAMVETLVAAMTRRRDIDGISIRLPGIVSRPKGPSGLKSAFMSDIFHAAAAGEQFISPVSADASMWMMSVERCTAAIVHALDVCNNRLPEHRAVNLPALRVRMGDLAEAVAKATGATPGWIDYKVDPDLEAGFGTQPELETNVADYAGFCHDGSLVDMVDRVIAGLGD